MSWFKYACACICASSWQFEHEESFKLHRSAWNFFILLRTAAWLRRGTDLALGWKSASCCSLLSVSSCVSHDEHCCWHWVSCANLAALRSSVSEDSLSCWHRVSCANLAVLCFRRPFLLFRIANLIVFCSSISEDHVCWLEQRFLASLVVLCSSVSVASFSHDTPFVDLINRARHFSGVSNCLHYRLFSLRLFNLSSQLSGESAIS